MYDLIILGGGAAGLAAAMYAARYKLDALIIAETVGGTAVTAGQIENWPGVQSITGIELMNRFRKHAESLGVLIKEETVAEIKNIDGIFVITDKKNNHYDARTIIIALGTKQRKLDVLGEENFIGRGVSYCVTCDGPIYRDRIVAIVGSGDAAAMASLMASEHAKKVYVICRSDGLHAEPITLDKIMRNEKITIITKTNIKEIKGKSLVEGIVLDNGIEIKLDGIFVEIGGVPSTSLALKIGVLVNDTGHIIVTNEQETNVLGVFAAGDITTKSANLRQVITSAAEGALAASSAFKYLKRKK